MITERDAEYWPLETIGKTLLLDGPDWFAAWEPGVRQFDIFRDRQGAELYARDLNIGDFHSVATVGADDWDGAEDAETYFRRAFLEWLNDDAADYEANGY